MTQQLLQSTMFHTTGVRLKQDLNITYAPNTVKVLALGITQLDGEELVKAVLKAPFLVNAGDESLRNGTRSSQSSSLFTTWRRTRLGLDCCAYAA
ncbi:unnamed protein product [Ectocarpus sp. 13 AM-2016]